MKNMIKKTAHFGLAILATASITIGDLAAQEEKSQSDRDKKFYRVISENSLFRPLGWRKPDNSPRYELIGTWVSAKGESAKALIKEQRSNQTFYVSIGDKAGEATVDKIETNLVNLTLSGNPITLTASRSAFISGGGGGRGSNRGENRNVEQKKGGDQDRKKGERRDRGRRDRGGESRDWRAKMKAKWENASPEERKKMMGEFKRRSGGGRGKRRGRGRGRD